MEIDYDNLFDEFGGIFDACSIGQYLGGVDPRNIPGNTDGFINETSVNNPSDFIYVWENGELFAEWSGRTIKVNNIHVHSKNLKRFMDCV